MKKTWIYGAATLMMAAALTTACSTKEEEGESGQGLTSSISSITASTSEGDSAVTAQNGTGPAIDANIVQDGRTAMITYSLINFHLSEDHMNKENVPGEGHLHLTVDGKQKAMLGKDVPLKLTNLATGKHEIKLELQQNDHSPLNVTKIFNIEVKE